jgi:hypothetical protein
LTIANLRSVEFAGLAACVRRRLVDRGATAAAAIAAARGRSARTSAGNVSAAIVIDGRGLASEKQGTRQSRDDASDSPSGPQVNVI